MLIDKLQLKRSSQLPPPMYDSYSEVVSKCFRYFDIKCVFFIYLLYINKYLNFLIKWQTKQLNI